MSVRAIHRPLRYGDAASYIDTLACIFLTTTTKARSLETITTAPTAAQPQLFDQTSTTSVAYTARKHGRKISIAPLGGCYAHHGYQQ